MKKLLIHILALIVGNSCLAAAAPKADFYLSPNGSDAWSGTLSNPNAQGTDGPFATLTRARDAVRDLKKSKSTDIVVLVREGTYLLEETVVFGLEDSGEGDSTITYAAYPGEKALFSSGVPIQGWRKVEEDLRRFPATARGHVWMAELPETLGRFHTLYDGEVMLPRARSSGMTPTGSRISPTERDSQKVDRHTLHFPAGFLKAWSNIGDVEVVIIPRWPWVMNILPLASVDEQQLVAKTAVPATYEMVQVTFGRFPSGTLWAENALEFLDEPGEWVLNTETRRLYLWPTGERPGDEIVGPKFTELIRVEGEIDYDGPTDTPVRGLVFRGLTFEHGDRFAWEPGKTGLGLQHDWEMFDRPTALLRLRGAESCVVERCRFAASGGAAVRLDLHAQKNEIRNNLIEHIGGAGVVLAGYGPGTKDVNRQNTVSNNHIHHVGKLLWHSLGIFAWQSGENRIANNLIHHTAYSGLAVTGRIRFDRTGKGECSRTIRWHEVDRVAPETPSYSDQTLAGWSRREPFLHARNNVVELNEIHDVMQILGDGNGIYISGAGGGNIVRENYIHDVDSWSNNAIIRCDDDQHKTLIERNVIFRCTGEGLLSKGNNHFVNNIVADLRSRTSEGVVSPRQRGYHVHPTGYPHGARLERNIFLSLEPGQRIFTEGGMNRGGTAFLKVYEAVDYNLYHCPRDTDWAKEYLERQRRDGLEVHSVEADPGFVNADDGDFRLAPDSPARRLGIEEIDPGLAGLTEEFPTEFR